METISSNAAAGVDREPILVDLALQGGGSHGAFTWGVLDRLLEEPWLEIDGISGTSAGAMNAAVLADGFAEGGGKRRAARRWRPFGAASPKRRASARSGAGRWMCCSAAGRWTIRPVYIAMDLMSRLFSPYDLNPAGQQSAAADPGRRRSISSGSRNSPIKLFITATNVRTGRPRVFRNSRDHAGRAARLGLPADDVSGHRDRRRESIGTAAIPAIPPSRRWCANVRRTTPSSSRSIRSNAQARRDPPPTFSIG